MAHDMEEEEEQEGEQELTNLECQPEGRRGRRRNGKKFERQPELVSLSSMQPALHEHE